MNKPIIERNKVFLIALIKTKIWIILSSFKIMIFLFFPNKLAELLELKFLVLKNI